MNGVITAIVPYIVPTIIVVTGYLYHLIFVHVPSQQRAYISMFADMAVRWVSVKFARYSDAQKEASALTAIKSLFKAFNLPAPPDSILVAIIAAAFTTLENPPIVSLKGKS